MIKSDKVMVLDVDGTLTIEGASASYSNAMASKAMKSRLTALKSEGYWIILFTSRNMRTHEGNIGAIMKNTAPVLINWLAENEIPYDEIHFGKPWCGHDGFYVDDRAVRPREFVENSIEQLRSMLKRDQLHI